MLDQQVTCAPATDTDSPVAWRRVAEGAKILFLVDEMSAITAGGTERQLLQMIEICKSNGMRPWVCVFRNTLWLTPEIAGCPVTHLHIEKLISWRGFLSLVRLTRWVHKQKPDILQTVFSEANLIGPCIARLAGVPIVLGTRRNLNHPRREDPHRWGLRLQTLANLLVNQVIANSRAVLERIVESEGISRRRICVVYNGIDLSEMRPAPHLRAPMRQTLGMKHDEILVGNVSGLRSIKGVQLFVDAAAESYRRDPRLRFVLIGDGELQEQMEQSIQRYGLEGVFTLAGAAEDVRPYLAAFDIAVLCSYAEGFSNSLLEYMACGLPVIATDVGGNREALASSGMLIQPDVQQLAGAIQVMSAPEVRNHFAACALRQVTNFDVSIAHDRMTRLYSHFLAAFGSKKRRVAQLIAHMPPRLKKIEEISSELYDI
ncbi:MAG: glycosyltransferase [Silvibacterium sp.]